MLIMRPQQIQAFEQYMLERFVQRMIGELRRCCPEETSTIDNDALAETIHSGIAIAERYDITDESDVERYLEFHVRYGPDFSTGKTVWAARYLKDETLTGHDKINEIWNHEFFEMNEGRSHGL